MQRREGQFVGQFNDSRTVLYHGVIQGSSGGSELKLEIATRSDHRNPSEGPPLSLYDLRLVASDL